MENKISDDKEEMLLEAFVLLTGEDKLKQMAKDCFMKAYFPEIYLSPQYEEPISEEDRIKHLESIEYGLDYLGLGDVKEIKE